MSALEHRCERERMPVAGLPLGLWSRTTIASIAGHAGASGNAFCKPFSRPVGSRPRNPCPDGYFGASRGYPAHTWQRQRPSHCRCADRGGWAHSPSDRRSRLRRQQPSPHTPINWDNTSHSRATVTQMSDPRTRSDATVIAGGSKLPSVA
jgi:hypothetical protein